MLLIVEVTDDPLVSRDALARLTENTKVVCLGTLGEWTYIEAEEDGVRLRGFVPTVCLYATVTDLSEARRAMAGSWRLLSFTACASVLHWERYDT